MDRETAVDDARRKARLDREEHISGRIRRFIDKHGPTPCTGKNGIWQRAKNSSDDRAEWERVLEQMIEDEHWF